MGQKRASWEGRSVLWSAPDELLTPVVYGKFGFCPYFPIFEPPCGGLTQVLSVSVLVSFSMSDAMPGKHMCKITIIFGVIYRNDGKSPPVHAGWFRIPEEASLCFVCLLGGCFQKDFDWRGKACSECGQHQPLGGKGGSDYIKRRGAPASVPLCS